MYHDSIISRRLKAVHRLPASPFASARQAFPDDPVAETASEGPALPLPSEHTRYTAYASRSSGTYRRAGRALVVMGYLQLLLEMVVVRPRAGEAKEVGRWRRWRMLVWWEGVKCVLCTVS